MTVRTVLSYMLELIGAFGYFNNSGSLKYKIFNKNNGQDIMIPIDKVMEYKRNGYSAIMNGARLNYGDDMGKGSFTWEPDYISVDKMEMERTKTLNRNTIIPRQPHSEK